MRALAALLIAFLAAASAGAQQPGLRGPVEPPKEETRSALPPPLPLASLPGQDAQRCRANCASSYYFCLSTESAEDCGPGWLQCRVACETPGRRQMISTIPPRP